MAIYNLKIVKYNTGEQDIVTYKTPVVTGEKKQKQESAYENMLIALGIRENDDSASRSAAEHVSKVMVEKPHLSAREIKSKLIHSQETSHARTIQTIYDYARANEWEWFLTFTADAKKVDRYDYDAMTKKMSQWLNNIRKRKCPDMKYLIVPEKHKDGAWHFHAVASNIGNLDFVDSGKKSKKLTIYNLPEWTNGFTTATKIQNTLKASNYITKYITKTLMCQTKGKRRYWNSKNLDVGEVTKELIDPATMEMIHTAYINGNEKRHKKVIVASHDYHNEINYITI